MKLTKIFNLMVLGTSLTMFASGCRHTPTGTTLIHGRPNQIGDGSGIGTGDPLPSPKNGGMGENDGRPRVLTGDFTGMTEDPSKPLAAQTVYFDYDKSAIKASEQGKLDAVANYLKDHPNVCVRVEGNCDERGTEEYNRALGERRAIAGRDYLMRLGVDGNRIATISYGLDHPVETARNESAFSKNRRDDFAVLLPPGK